ESSWWETACEDRALPRESESQTEVWLFFCSIFSIFSLCLLFFSIVLTWTFSWKTQGGLDQFSLYLGEKRLSFVKEHKNFLKLVGPSWL
ncbi:hypothetical protein, partial [uncultured Lactobacillus sp.]|uniref:hypothetical protein n=1 Tax=uncultured Lactobacillus sp. TaxID=153152 RepID=UPI002666DA3D